MCGEGAPQPSELVMNRWADAASMRVIIIYLSLSIYIYVSMYLSNYIYIHIYI